MTVEVKFESWQLSDEQFFQLCQDNRDLRLERNPKGDLIIMPPTGGKTSNSNAGITAQLWLWNNLHKLGVVFDSSGGFKLPNGADRSPDAAWIPLEKWQALTPQQKERFLPLSPDFVIELMSASDNLETARKKMQEYLDNVPTIVVLPLTCNLAVIEAKLVGKNPIPTLFPVIIKSPLLY